jgi:histidine triad (HIT) family protein
MPSDPSCIFCKIVAGQIPSAKVLETDAVLAFLDIAPIAPGHTLAVPKEHFATLADTSAGAAAALAAELPGLVRAVLAATGAPAINVVQNNGREAGQVVGHVHFHLIPRSAGDGIRIPWPQGRYEGDAMEKMRSRIAAALGR